MDGLSEESFDTSDEDIYTNAVARFKAAKKKERLKPRKKEHILSFVEDDDTLEIVNNEETNEGEDRQSVSSTSNEGIEIHDGSSSDVDSSANQVIDSDLEITGITNESPKNQDDCIVIDHDDSADLQSMAASSLKNDLLENENYSVEVKILWRSHKLVYLNMRMHEKFQLAFEHFEKLENVPIERILLLRKDKPIKPNDTPASLGISVLDIIEGGVIDLEFANDQSKDYEQNDNICKIKIQKSQKESIMVNLQKDQPFKFAIIQCATQLDIPASKIKLYFDGDLINSDDTPESLEFDDEACVDLKISA